jgi:hypothetical protein
MKFVSASSGLWLTGRQQGRRNRPPVTVADSASVFAGTPTVIAVLANDSDPEGGALTLVSATATFGSAVVQAGGTVRYTPPAGYTGPDSVTYVVADPQGAQAQGTLAITVAGPALAMTTNVDGTLTVAAATGQVTVTVTSPPALAGTYVTDTALLSGGPVALRPPSVSGSGQVGTQLSAQSGLWIFEGVLSSQSWSWRRNGALIAGATAPTYTVTAADASTQLVAEQTATASGGTRTAASAAFAVPAPFSPSDDAGLIGWYDAALTSTITRSGTSLTSWASRIGSGTLAGVSSPTSGTRTVAGRNVVDFTGTARLSGSIALPANGNVAFHIAVAIDSVASAFAAALAANATRDFQLDAGSDTAFNGRLNVRNIGDTLALSGGPYTGLRVFSLIFDRTGAGTSRVLVNGVQIGSGAYSTALDPAPGFVVMANRSQNAFVDGAVGEVIVTGNLNATSQHVAHLLDKWGGV